MNPDLSNKSAYFKHTLLALLRDERSKEDPRYIKALIEYGDDRTCSIEDPRAIIKLAAIKGKISVKYNVSENMIEVCLNCPDYGKPVRREEIIKLTENENLPSLLRPIWRHGVSGIYSVAMKLWLFDRRVVLKDPCDKFAFGRGFDHFEIQS